MLRQGRWGFESRAALGGNGTRRRRLPAKNRGSDSGSMRFSHHRITQRGAKGGEIARENGRRAPCSNHLHGEFGAAHICTRTGGRLQQEIKKRRNSPVRQGHRGIGKEYDAAVWAHPLRRAGAQDKPRIGGIGGKQSTKMDLWATSEKINKREEGNESSD